LNELSNLKGLVEAELARRTDLEKQIKIERIFVEPIYRGDERIGSRVWIGDVELEESDPRFRQAVIGNKRHPGVAPDFPDDHPAFRRVVLREPAPGSERTAAEDAIVASAAAKIAALRAKQ
jgi:hypothetical protein